MLDPRLVIVPILGLGEAGEVQRFLGTGSFVGPEALLLTAEHVIRDWDSDFAVVTMHDLKTLYPARVIASDPAHDLALLKVTGYRPTEPLSFSLDKIVHSNQPLCTFDYGTTLSAGDEIRLNPATRVGNMTRILDLTDRFGPAGDAALELSFPALRGASGAPVLTNDAEFRVCGVIVANVSYHLLPAQIESVLDNSQTIVEETRFMLPQAMAVNIRHLRHIYDEARSSSEE